MMLDPNISISKIHSIENIQIPNENQPYVKVDVTTNEDGLLQRNIHVLSKDMWGRISKLD